MAALAPIPRPVSIKREQTGDAQLDRVQEELRRTTEALNALLRIAADNPFLRGRPIAVNFVTPSVYQTIRHNLGEPAQAILIRQNYGGASRPGFNENPAPPVGIDHNNELSMRSDVACTVVFWFCPRTVLPIDSATQQSPVL